MNQSEKTVERLTEIHEALAHLKRQPEFGAYTTLLNQHLQDLRDEMDGWGVMPWTIERGKIDAQLARIDEVKQLLDIPDELRRDLRRQLNPKQLTRSKQGE